jgi:hypothetical protein
MFAALAGSELDLGTVKTTAPTILEGPGHVRPAVHLGRWGAPRGRRVPRQTAWEALWEGQDGVADSMVRRQTTHPVVSPSGWGRTSKSTHVPDVPADGG